MVFSKKLTPEEFDPEVIMNSGQVFRMKKEANADCYEQRRNEAFASF